MVSATAMRALRRVTASLVAALLLLAGPPGVAKRCAECPPDCPMHARPAGNGPAQKQPGCHRAGAPAPAAGVCLRSTCGHDATSESASAGVTLPAHRPEMIAPAPRPRLQAPRLAVASLAAPEPPLQPPRTAPA
jgi:hypothetical protein